MQPVTPLKVVPANSALRMRAILDFEDETGDKRTAGDEWLFEGPGEIQNNAFHLDRQCCGVAYPRHSNSERLGVHRTIAFV